MVRPKLKGKGQFKAPDLPLPIYFTVNQMRRWFIAFVDTESLQKQWSSSVTRELISKQLEPIKGCRLHSLQNDAMHVVSTCIQRGTWIQACFFRSTSHLSQLFFLQFDMYLIFVWHKKQSLTFPYLLMVKKTAYPFTGWAELRPLVRICVEIWPQLFLVILQTNRQTKSIKR